MVWLALGFLGVFFLVYKTLFAPILIGSALTIPAVRFPAFLRAWVPFLTATILFDFARGGIYRIIRVAGRTIYLSYVIRWETALTGIPAVPLVVQRVSSPWLDWLAMLFHVAHFLYFLAIGLWIWTRDPKLAAWWQRAMVATMLCGLIGYALVPTIPPWMASELGYLPAMRHVTGLIYQHIAPGLHATFDTNPVAAMPSLHAAFPIVCALVGQQCVGWRGTLLLWLYVVGLVWAILYLGEHYLVDVLAGALVAAVAVYMARPRAVSFYDEFSA